MISPSQSPYMLKVWSLQISSNEYYKSGQKINNTLLIVCPVPNKAICRYCLENYILNVRSFASMKAERSQLTFYNELLNSSLRPLKDFCGGVQLFSTSNFWLFTAVNWPAFTFLSRQEKAGKKSHEKKIVYYLQRFQITILLINFFIALLLQSCNKSYIWPWQVW